MNSKWDLFSLQGNVIRELSGFLFITMVDGSLKGFIADSDNINVLSYFYLKVILKKFLSKMKHLEV